MARIGRRRVEGKALLETNEIIFRDDSRLVIPLSEITAISIADDDLVVAYLGGVALFSLGAATAKKWAEKIAAPKGRIDKLGVKAGASIAILGEVEAELAVEIRARGASVAEKARRDCDAIFFGVSRFADLAQLEALKGALLPAGAIWVIRPKGPEATVTDGDVIRAGRAAGLVDVKVVSFSATRSAQKFVIPVARRAATKKR